MLRRSARLQQLPLEEEIAVCIEVIEDILAIINVPRLKDFEALKCLNDGSLRKWVQLAECFLQ